MSGITLTAGVRQNLLSLQSTADMMSSTQNRLATGKKVNSALDNPSNFFTSSSLNDRASDLGALLDSIGQATKTLDAANNGITSLTKLVQSAKSTAQQARQATGQTTTYAAVNANADISAAANLNGTETTATVTANNALTGNMGASAIALDFTSLTETLGSATGGTFANDAAVAALTGTGTLELSFTGKNGLAKTASVTLDFSTIVDKAGLLTAINTASTSGGGTVSDSLTASYSAGNVLTLSANTADVDFSILNTSTAGTLTSTGFTAAATTSTSLLDRVTAAGGVAGTSTLTLDVNGGSGAGGTTKTLTFGTGSTQITTFADLDTELNNNGIGSGASGDVTGTTFTAGANAPHLTLAHASGKTNTLKLSVSDVGVRAALGMGAAVAAGQTGGIGNTPTTLTRTFNSAPTLADTNPSALSSGGNMSITVNGSTQTVGLLGTDRLDDIITKLSSNSTLGNNLTFSDNGSGDLSITARNSDVDFTVVSTAASLGVGFSGTDFNAKDSLSLLDRLGTKMGSTAAAQGSTMTVAVNGGAAQTITFGTGADEVSTRAELSTKLGGLSGVTASLNGNSLNLQVASGTAATSLDIGGTAATALGVSGTRSGAVTSTTANATRSSLQSDFNNVLTQIDSLAKDASYNGNNLLNGDDLKVTFNENGSSSLTIKGVTFDSNNLGLNAQAGTSFQDNTAIDAVIANADKALNTLRTQASKFGSTLTTVQTRQDFTKNMMNTLQTGADALVLADTNEEGANLLALQTRQQLSTTALSMANQASQAVLRLF
jgi:flagellin